MEGSHLISPCVWQNDVNRTYCIVGSDWIEKAFRIFPTLQILGVCDNNTGSTRVKCSMLFILLKYPVYKSWETSEVQRTLLYQPLMRSRTREAEISFEWALLLLTPKRACSHRKFLIPTKNSRFPLRLCGSPLFICYYFDHCFYFRIIRCQWPSRSCDRWEGNVAWGVLIAFGFEPNKTRCTAFKWLFKYLITLGL